MGIRYCAWAIDDEDLEWMAEFPCTCQCRDPRPERREALRRLDVLELDKAWWYFQELFDAMGTEAGRPAGRLVLSHDMMHTIDYEPSYGLVPASHVAEAAADLARVTLDEVRALTSRRDRSEQRQFGGLQNFLIERLELARRYTERLAGRGLALRYRIG